MKKIWIGITIVTVLAIFVGVGVYRASTAKSVSVKTTQLTEREITGNVMIPGTLHLANEQKVFVDPQLGEVKEILVKEGEEIKKGTTLVKYENEQLELEKEQNQLAIESNYLRINQIKDQINDIEKKEKDLEKEIGKEEAEKQIKSEKSQLEMELKMANIELKQNILQKNTIEKKLAELEVKSEMDGVVIQINKDALSSGAEPQVLIHIGSLNQFKVTGVISEYDTLKVQENQPVTLKSDVMPDQKWKGKVSKIAFLPEDTDPMTQNSGAVQYPIEVVIEDNQNIPVKPGFQMIMEIETERKKVKAIPLEAIQQEDDTHFVYVVENGKTVKKEIKVGTSDDQFMEVKNGLTKEDKVIVHPPDQLKAGMEVTIQ
ncbi:efflux RND transporter periplasmic adaptor subunit [Aeribacillus alveayuensis]|uniref:HlyD family secretion protein n=1 Tax=Aeribacillus alveayuensis TaxID=279215 RepID=A0ABT9VMI3_9BACI|nr:HlyD family secretion protein [Bacillus alveayuensis]